MWKNTIVEKIFRNIKWKETKCKKGWSLFSANYKKEHLSIWVKTKKENNDSNFNKKDNA